MTASNPPALLYHAGGLGDFVLSLPAIFRVRSAWDRCRWLYWGPAERLALLPGFAATPPELRQQGHTLWGSAPPPPVLRFLDRCRVVLAFGGNRPPAWAGVAGDRAVAVSSFPPAAGPWVPLHQSRQLDTLGVPRTRTPWIRGWRRSVLPRRGRTHVVIHPGSGDRKKNLPIEVWADVISRLRREGSGAVGTLAGPVEVERGGWEPIVPAVDEVWRCSGLGDLLDVLSRAELFLGNDSGVAHLAGLLGIPTVVVFGPSDPTLWRPLGPQVRVVRAHCRCAPCSAGQPVTCLEATCLQTISAVEIADVAKELRKAPVAREP